MAEPPPGGRPARETAGPAPGAAAAIRVVLADDSVLFREGLARVLAENGFAVAGQAGDADGLLAAVQRETPDVVVTDIRMPPTYTSEGLQAAQRIRAGHPGVGVLVLSQYVETLHAVKLLQDVPQRVGYLLKDRVCDIAEFTDAVRRVARGGSVIDPEVVAQLLRRGGGGTLEVPHREFIAFPIIRWQDSAMAAAASSPRSWVKRVEPGTSAIRKVVRR